MKDYYTKPVEKLSTEDLLEIKSKILAKDKKLSYELYVLDMIDKILAKRKSK